MRLPKLLLSLTLAAWLAGAVLPNRAEAAVGCDCATLSSLLSRATQAIISGIVNPLALAIEKAAGYATVNLHQDLSAIREAIILAQEQTAEAIERADLSQADRLSERTYEPASQPATNCLNDLLGQVWREAAPLRDTIRENLFKAVAQRNARFQRPADYLREINANPLPATSLSRLLGPAPGALTLTTAEFERAGEALGELTEPLPTPNLPPDLAKSPAGQLYAAAQTDLSHRLAIYQGVLAQRLTSRAPALGGLTEWVERKWRDMGGSGSPPGLVEGQLSETSLMWYLTNLRLGSANWHEKVLPTLPEAGLLRELAAMGAIELELSRRQNAHLENIALMLALAGLDQLDQRARPALRNQYRQALGAR